MKLELFLSRSAALGSAVAFSGFALDLLALPLFAVSSALFLLLVTAGDYTRRPRYALSTAPAARRREVMPLAA